MAFWRGLAVLLIIAFGTVYVMGRRLPREHHAVAQGIVQASQDRVWQLVDDTSTQSQWRATLDKVVPIQDTVDGRCWVEFHSKTAITLCQVEEAPKSRLVVRSLGNPSFDGTWTYTFRPASENATEVTMVEDSLIKSPFNRFLGHYILGEHTNVKQFLDDLQAEAIRRR